MAVIMLDQNWRSPDGSEWVVVGISSDGTIALSGPGPCRSVKYVAVDELEREWELSACPF